MFYYTSDLHFGHSNCIEMCNRPFKTVEEMDETLIENWNKVVKRNDDVYILGDLIFRAELEPAAYLKRLKGKKHLIIGNHDKTWLQKVNLSEFFESTARLDILNTGHGKATLCHFPMMDFEGHYLIHGHIHGSTNQNYWHVLKESDRTLNAGVDVNNFKPVTFEELVENNIRYKAEH